MSNTSAKGVVVDIKPSAKEIVVDTKYFNEVKMFGILLCHCLRKNLNQPLFDKG